MFIWLVDEWRSIFGIEKAIYGCLWETMGCVMLSVWKTPCTYTHTSAHTFILLDTRIRMAPWVLRKYVSWFKSQDLVFHHAQNPLLKLNWSEMIASLQRENKMEQSKKQQKKYYIQQFSHPVSLHLLFSFSTFQISMVFKFPSPSSPFSKDNLTSQFPTSWRR